MTYYLDTLPPAAPITLEVLKGEKGAVYAGMQVFLNLQCQEGAYVELEHEGRRTLVRLLLRGDEHGKCLYVDSASAFDLGIDLYLVLGMQVHIQAQRYYIETTASRGAIIPLATQCTLAVIASTAETTLSYAEDLASYFSTTERRVLHEGQVVAPPSESAVQFQCTTLQLQEQGSEFGYIDPNQTLLQVSGQVHTRSFPREPAIILPFGHEANKVQDALLTSFATIVLSKQTPRVLLTGLRHSGKRVLVQSIAHRLGIALVEENAYNLLGHMEDETSQRLKELVQSCIRQQPCLLHLRRFGAFLDQTKSLSRTQSDVKERSLEGTEVMLQQLIQSLKNQQVSIGMLISTGSPEDVSPSCRSLFTHEVSLSDPDVETKLKLLQLAQPKASKEDAKKLVGLPRSKTLYVAASCFLEGSMDHMDDSIAQASRSDNSHSVQIPHVEWADVGGLETVKQEIMDLLETSNDHSLRGRSGLLLYGPPGSGKSLVAKAIATEFACNFLSVKGPELLNMYVGESEANVRRIFDKARRSSPCVLFFDELDSLAPARGNGADSGGVMDRVVSQLLVELNGMQTKEHDDAQVFLIGATNRPDLLDPALLRPGRLERCLYLGVSADATAQTKILQALTRKFHLAPGTDLHALAEQCPRHMTGADFYALCSDALLVAIKRVIEEYETSTDAAATKPTEVPCVTQADFTAALERLQPSISLEELAKYEQLRHTFSASS